MAGIRPISQYTDFLSVNSWDISHNHGCSPSMNGHFRVNMQFQTMKNGGSPRYIFYFQTEVAEVLALEREGTHVPESNNQGASEDAKS